MTYPGAGFVTFSGWALGRDGVQCFLKAVWHVLIWTFDPTPWDLLRYSNFTWPDSSPSNLCIIIAAFDVQHPKLGRIATAILTCQAKFLGGKSWSLTVEKLVISGGFNRFLLSSSFAVKNCPIWLYWIYHDVSNTEFQSLQVSFGFLGSGYPLPTESQIVQYHNDVPLIFTVTIRSF